MNAQASTRIASAKPAAVPTPAAATQDAAIRPLTAGRAAVRRPAGPLTRSHRLEAAPPGLAGRQRSPRRPAPARPRPRAPAVPAGPAGRPRGRAGTVRSPRPGAWRAGPGRLAGTVRATD